VFGNPVRKNKHTDIGKYGKGKAVEPYDHKDEGRKEPHRKGAGEGEPEAGPYKVDIDDDKEAVYAAYDGYYGCSRRCRLD